MKMILPVPEFRPYIRAGWKSWDCRSYELTEAWSADFTAAGRRYSVRIPSGFVTDFGSIPRAFWSVLSPTGRGMVAYLVHDWFYRTPDEPVTRSEADAVLRELLARVGFSKAERSGVWMAVRLFGSVAYKRRILRS